MINAATLPKKDYGEKITPRSVFWALNSRLPLMAAEAAVEFDWIIQGKRGEPGLSFEAIDSLASLLNDSLGKTQLEAGSKAFSDPLGLSLFAKAYNETNKDHPVKTRAELLEAVNELTTSLKKIQEGSKIDNSVLEKMRNFFVALSEYATVYRKMVYGNRQEHPYRK